MKPFLILTVTVVLLLALAGTASAAETSPDKTGVTTNVWFAKMNTIGDTYSFRYLPTLYLGKNDYGRLVFVTGASNLAPGDYAIVQQTRNGTQLIQSIKITKYGNVTPEYVMLTLELTKEDLAGPLVTYNTSRISPAVTDASAAVSVPLASGSDTRKSAPAPLPPSTRAPVNPATILAAAGIAACILGTRLSRE